MILETILNDYVDGYGRKVDREDNPLSEDGYKSIFLRIIVKIIIRNFLTFHYGIKLRNIK